MARLQVEIDEENETRTELYQLRKKAKGSEQKRNVQAMIVRSSLLFCSINVFCHPYFDLKDRYRGERPGVREREGGGGGGVNLEVWAVASYGGKGKGVRWHAPLENLWNLS